MNKSTLKRFWSYIGKYKKNLIGVFICSLFSNTFLIFAPLLTGKAIDKIIGPNKVDFRGLIPVILLMLLFYLASSIFQWLMMILSNVAANQITKDIRKEAFDHLNTLPLQFFDRTPHGDIISRLTNDIDAISDGLLQGITQVISAIIIIVGSFLFMLSINPLITLVVLIITPLCFFIAAFIAKQSKRMFTGQTRAVGELNGYVEEMIGNQKVVKAFSYEKKSLETFKNKNDELYVWGQKAQWYSSLTNPTTRFINNTSYVAVTVIGGFLSVAGRLSVGNIASFLTYSNQFAKPINEITALSSQIQSAFASIERIFSLIDEESEVKDFHEAKTIKKPKGGFEFKNVSFSYEPEEPLIENLNLSVKPTNMIAIVGPTGSGKTTLVNLIMRFYPINSGNIIIDGDSIYNITRDSLRQSIGMVLQESWLFKGTVAQNIAYGKPDATREEIINAAKESMAHSFIKRLPKGYDTLISEDGGNLSQGQKQLLTITRVMLINPSILILDEATSNIDTRTEIKIQKAFTKMMEGKTSFVIAHRLSTIRGADVILVLKDGNIIEQGNHEELLDKKGFYYTMYHSQFAK